MPSFIRIAYIFFLLLFSGTCFGKNRGKRLAILLPRLGPTFVKLGQTLSVRPDLVGEETAQTLGTLRDNMPPFSAARARRIVEKELGKPVAELFLRFDEQAVAAASIAQVHKAVTFEGHTVAVKILRPGIKRAFKRDIALFYSIARLLNRFKPWQRLRPIEVVDMLAESVRKELDLRIEAASANQLKENCKGDKGIHVPQAYWLLTSERILTLEWVEGIPIHHTEALRQAGHDLPQLAQHLAVSFFNQAYRDGFFHADIHPGNLFVNKEGILVPVDFGIMGLLDASTRRFVAEILRGFLEGDYDHVARIHFEAGYVPEHHRREDFALACRAIGEPILGLPANQISIANLLALLFKITKDFDMPTQPQLLLLQKTMVLVEGVGASLNPDVNLWELARPWIETWAKENLSPKARAREALVHLAAALKSLPQKCEHLAQCFTAEGIRLHPETLHALKKHRRIALFSWQSLLLSVIVALSSGYIALYFFS